VTTAGGRRRRALYVAGDAAGAEEVAALDWIRSRPGWDVIATSLGDLLSASTAVRQADVVWIHAGSAVPSPAPAALAALRARLSAGGPMLLTLLAATLVAPLGLEPQGPNDVGVGEWRDADDPLRPDDFGDWPDFPRVRGVQGYGPHPLFDGFVRGTDSWRATAGERVARAVYAAPAWPARGRVVGVERAFLRLEAGRVVAWEYVAGGGRVMCVGAHLHFAAADRTLATQRDRLAGNALDLLVRRTPAVSRWWPRPDAPPAALGRADAPVASLGAELPAAVGAVTLTSLARADDPFTVAGRRALVVGGERLGVREIWVHPLCVLSGGIDVRVDGEVPDAQSVEVVPGQVIRRLRTRARAVEERVFVPVKHGAAVVEYHDRGAAIPASGAAGVPPRLELTMRLPLRLQWPMPPDLLQPIAVTRGVGDDAVSIALVGRDERHAALLHVEGPVTLRFTEHADAPRVVVTAELSAPVRLTFAASTRGVSGLAARLARVERAGVRALAADRAAHAAALHDRHVGLRSPSASLDMALEWAKVRLTSFVASAPGVGTGLMAGYAASRPGWSESRPGFAWFFGRDACWTGFALLAAGLFDEARLALELLADTQDVTGKIIHELSTSGSAHYDAADSTPLFLLFLADYARWSGDLATVRRLWPAAVRALEFVLSTDRDRDGLPENTGVGHGWIEMGPLGGGGAATAYLAAVWIAALEALAPVARAAADLRTADRCDRAREAARRAFDERLVDAATGRVALHRTAAGALVPDETALVAVPVALGAVGGARAARALESLDAERYAAPWGVRLLPRGHPLYDPAGYHAGAVWPLFTGWVSLADYAAHRGEPGFRRLIANTMLCYDRAKGAFDEVLHGDEPKSAGGCPDQAWSAGMVVLPFVAGMLGARPDALARKLRLAPHWPREWPHARVANLRVGRAALTLEADEGCVMEGAPRPGVRYRVRCLPRGALTLTLEHPLRGRSIGRVLVDGREVEPERAGTDECPHLAVTLWLDGTHELQFVEPEA